MQSPLNSNFSQTAEEAGTGLRYRFPELAVESSGGELGESGGELPGAGGGLRSAEDGLPSFRVRRDALPGGQLRVRRCKTFQVRYLWH